MPFTRDAPAVLSTEGASFRSRLFARVVLGTSICFWLAVIIYPDWVSNLRLLLATSVPMLLWYSHTMLEIWREVYSANCDQIGEIRKLIAICENARAFLAEPEGAGTTLDCPELSPCVHGQTSDSLRGSRGSIEFCATACAAVLLAAALTRAWSHDRQLPGTKPPVRRDNVRLRTAPAGRLERNHDSTPVAGAFRLSQVAAESTRKVAVTVFVAVGSWSG